jgi:hypothetical protein
LCLCADGFNKIVTKNMDDGYLTSSPLYCTGQT